jgi:outer membrane protein TolC
MLAGALVALWARPTFAQQPAPAPAQSAPQSGPTLTLQQAEMMALQNHPQIQAAQNEAAFTNQQIVEARSAYFPTVNADVTGSGANVGARIGAAFITDSRLFDV